MLDPGILRNASAGALARRLAGHRFRAPCRHGKWLILPTDGPALLIHSGMTGHPYYTDAGAEPEKYERLVVSLDKGELRYADLRKLRGIWLADDEDDLADVLGPQGPDALRMGLREFRDVMAGRRGRVKPTLMDQSVIAGLGNLLVDEICWRARIRPLVPVAELDDEAVKDLHRAMTQVLHTAVRHGRIGGRMSFWCPHCQP